MAAKKKSRKGKSRTGGRKMGGKPAPMKNPDEDPGQGMSESR